MLAKLSECITQSLIDNQIIESEERELYRYGIQEGLTIVLNLVTTLLIGLLCDMIWQSIVFTVAYIPLRSFAGGYHAKTTIGCYIFSIVLITAVLLTMKLLPISSFVCCIMLLCSGVCIFVLAPVENHNKPLDDVELTVYGQRSRWITVLEIMLALLCGGLGLQDISMCLSVSLVIMSVMLILEAIKNELGI